MLSSSASWAITVSTCSRTAFSSVGIELYPFTGCKWYRTIVSCSQFSLRIIFIRCTSCVLSLTSSETFKISNPKALTFLFLVELSLNQTLPQRIPLYTFQTPQEYPLYYSSYVVNVAPCCNCHANQSFFFLQKFQISNFNFQKFSFQMRRDTQVKLGSQPMNCQKRLAWCSGYHICLTRRRSPVQSWALILLFFNFYSSCSSVSDTISIILSLRFKYKSFESGKRTKPDEDSLTAFLYFSHSSC